MCGSISFSFGAISLPRKRERRKERGCFYLRERREREALLKTKVPFLNPREKTKGFVLWEVLGSCCWCLDELGQPLGVVQRLEKVHPGSPLV